MGRKRQSLDFSAKPRRRSALRAGPVVAAGAVIGLAVGAFLAVSRSGPVAEEGSEAPMSYETLSATMPALSEEDFEAMDLDGDGLLDAEERAAAEAAGRIGSL